MSHNFWMEQFKEQLNGLSQSFKESGTSLSLLAYAIKHNYLSSNNYLKSAMTHYELPMLQSRFFSETLLSQEMLAKWATHYPWSEECLPVAEWDNILIIACLQPPQDFPSQPSCSFVLASYENLEQTWNQMQTAKAKPSIPSAIPASIPSLGDIPEGIDLSAATAIKSAPSDGFSFDDLAVDEEKEPEIEASVDSESESSEQKDSSEENHALEGLYDGPTVVRLEALPPKEIVPPPQQQIQETIVAKKEPAEKPLLPVSRSPGLAKPSVNSSISANYLLEQVKKKNSTALNDKIKITLSQMKTHFEKSMILTVDNSESEVMAFAWDENFKSSSESSAPVPLRTPSIFSIVASTQKPFHGYISLNEINEKFFEDWNQGQIPDHVTISPIIVNERLMGMLMGFGSKATYNKTSLSLAEKLSIDFAKTLQAA